MKDKITDLKLIMVSSLCKDFHLTEENQNAVWHINYLLIDLRYLRLRGKPYPDHFIKSIAHTYILKLKGKED